MNILKNNPPLQNNYDPFQNEIINRYQHLLYIFNWIRVVPFSKRYADYVWAYPDFIFKVNKASPADKSILLCNFFMGIGKIEEELDEDYREK